MRANSPLIARARAAKVLATLCPTCKPKATGAPPARSHDLLQALTSALEISRHRARPHRRPHRVLPARVTRVRCREGASATRALRRTLELESIRASGLEFEQVKACLNGQPVEGVSASRIPPRGRETGAAARRELAVRRRERRRTASLRGRPPSVLCAPVTDPWTKAPLAVLYFQTRPGPAAATRPTTCRSFGATPPRSATRSACSSPASSATASSRRSGSGCSAIGAASRPSSSATAKRSRRLRAELRTTYPPATVARRPRLILVLGDTGTGKDLESPAIFITTRPRAAARPSSSATAPASSGDLVRTTLFGHVNGAVHRRPRADALGLLPLPRPGHAVPRRDRRAAGGGAGAALEGARPLDGAVRWATRARPGRTSSSSAPPTATWRPSCATAASTTTCQRLKALTIRLTPLRTRPGDVRPLLAHFLAEAEKDLKKRTRGLTPAALRALLAYAWPGNVREASGVAWALVTHARAGAEIDLADVERHCPEVTGASTRWPRSPRTRLLGAVPRRARRLRARVLRAAAGAAPLERARGRAQHGPRPRRFLYRYLQRHGLRQGGP